jgi:hypothetical protein
MIDRWDVAGYLLNSLVAATFYFVVSRLFSPGQVPAELDALKALAFGLILELFFSGRTRRRASTSKSRFSPSRLITLGVLSLGLCAGYWLFDNPRPAGSALYLLYAVMVPPVILLIAGIWLLRRSRAGRSE